MMRSSIPVDLIARICLAAFFGLEMQNYSAEPTRQLDSLSVSVPHHLSSSSVVWLIVGK